MWSFVKGSICDSSGVFSLKKDRITYSDHKAKASFLNQHFISVFAKEDNNSTPFLEKSPYPDMNNFEVHVTAVKKLLQNLNPYKASRPDSIPTIFLKETSFEIAPALTFVYQASLQKEKVPIASDWKHAMFHHSSLKVMAVKLQTPDLFSLLQCAVKSLNMYCIVRS